MKDKFYVICLSFVISFLIPFSVYANYFTLPVDADPSTDISSWFDHDTISGQVTVFTGIVYTGSEASLSTCGNYNDGAGCYDGHNGLDFAAASGTDALAAADGEVAEVYWNSCGGWTMRVWHDDIGLSTLYAHIATATVATTSDPVSRFEHIAEVNSTGSCSTGAHLHFGVADGNSQGSNRIDPFGWQGTTTDPWPYNQGYLWTTDPPSFSLANTVSSDITSDTTWRGNVVVSGVVSVTSGNTLTVDPGTVVKFANTSSGFVVDGVLDVNGTSSRKVYFTSYKDDTVGGDTNNNGHSVGARGDWRMIRVTSTGAAYVTGSVIRDGGYYGGSDCAYTPVVVCNDWGVLTISDTQVASSSNYGIQSIFGTTTINNSDIAYHGSDGFRASGGYVIVATSTLRSNGGYGLFKDDRGFISINGNVFSNNTSGAAYINLAYQQPTIVHSGNSVSGGGWRGFVMEGPLYTNQTWNADVPYILGEFEISSGKTLHIEPGAVLKFNGGSATLTVSGTVKALGATSTPIYFTSTKDDSVSGDTNADGTTVPGRGDWSGIKFNSGSVGIINHAVVRYGGGYGWGEASNVFNYGGVLNMYRTEIASSSYRGVYAILGTTTILYGNTQLNNGIGISREGGYFSMASSSVSGNGVGLENSAATTTATYNYWGNSSGPYHDGQNPSGTGESVSGSVDIVPWLTASPL